MMMRRSEQRVRTRALWFREDEVGLFPDAHNKELV
jgi:hypothetical protein